MGSLRSIRREAVLDAKPPWNPWETVIETLSDLGLKFAPVLANTLTVGPLGPGRFCEIAIDIGEDIMVVTYQEYSGLRFETTSQMFVLDGAEASLARSIRGFFKWAR